MNRLTVYIVPDAWREIKGLPGHMRQFVFTPLALVDLLADLPFYLTFVGLDLRIVRMIRLVRVLRVAKLGRYITALDLLGQVFKSKREELVISSAPASSKKSRNANPNAAAPIAAANSQSTGRNDGGRRRHGRWGGQPPHRHARLPGPPLTRTCRRRTRPAAAVPRPLGPAAPPAPGRATQAARPAARPAHSVVVRSCSHLLAGI